MKLSDRLKIGSQILVSKTTGSPRPFFVQYGLLNACNARCAYCNYPDRPDARIPVGQHLLALREFARLGALRIKFLGGEPLLFEPLDTLVDEVRRLGMRSSIVTNGFLIPERMDLVRQIDEIAISIDGSEEAHDRQRGAGTWRRVMAAIEACHREKLDFFLTAVVTKRSLDELDWLIATARRFQVMLNLQMLQHKEELYGVEAREWLPSRDEARVLLNRIIAAKRAGAPILFTERSHRQTLEWEDFSVERLERPGERSPCVAGTYFVHMDANGDLYPCFQHVGSFAAKNVFSDGVEAAWRNTQQHTCVSCYCTWLNECRAIFDLQPAVLANFWQNYMRPHAPGGALDASG